LVVLPIPSEASGQVTITVGAGGVQDAAGNANLSPFTTPSDLLTRDPSNPTVVSSVFKIGETVSQYGFIAQEVSKVSLELMTSELVGGVGGPDKFTPTIGSVTAVTYSGSRVDVEVSFGANDGEGEVRATATAGAFSDLAGNPFAGVYTTPQGALTRDGRGQA
jgi:hypothetical protein